MDRALTNAFIHMISWLTTDFNMSKREAQLHMTANSLVRITLPVHQRLLCLWRSSSRRAASDVSGQCRREDHPLRLSNFRRPRLISAAGACAWA